MKRTRSTTRRKIIVVLLSLLSVLVILVIVAFLLIHNYVNKMKLVPSSGSSVMAVVEAKSSEGSPAITVEEYEDSDPKAENSPESEITSLEKNIQVNMKKDSSPILYDKNVFNVLLIGSDTRENGGWGRSDVMLLVSINKKSKKIITTSFLRDIYLQIPGKKNNRLNAAFAFGGAELLMDTMEENFKFKIDHYASINFYSFIDIVDAVGGITLEITEDEISVINSYLCEINRLTGDTEGTDYLTESGTLQLNGKQALAYSRNRYVGNGDFARTGRQRAVLEQVFLKVKELNIIELKKLLEVLLPEITTNLSEGEIFSLILSLPSYMKYDREEWSVPDAASYKSMCIRGMAVLGIDFDKNINEIYQKIYEKEYVINKP